MSTSRKTSREKRNEEEKKDYKRFCYTEEDLVRAVQDIKEGRLSLNGASRQYGVPKGTLSNKVNNKVPIARKMGPPTVLTVQEESDITNWIIKKAILGFPLHPEDVKDSIQAVLKECPRANPFHDERPGNKWLRLFMKRHPEIKRRNTEAISKARAEVTKENLGDWFNTLQNFLLHRGIEHIFEDGKRVLNLDETGCLTNPKTGKVLGPKQLPDFYEVATTSDKQSITVLCTYSADGSALPPMVVYPHKRVNSSVMLSMPEGWGYGMSDSGWMVSDTFLQYIEKIVFPWLINNEVQFPVIIFLDGHRSHLSYQLAKYCAEKDIIIYCLPPNATHIVQPCDVGIFRPLKNEWRKVVRREKLKGNDINKVNFAKYFKQAFDTIRTDVIKNAFRKCGLFPLDISAIDFKKCLSDRKRLHDADPTTDDLPLCDYGTALRVLEAYQVSNLDQDLTSFCKWCKEKISGTSNTFKKSGGSRSISPCPSMMSLDQGETPQPPKSPGLTSICPPSTSFGDGDKSQPPESSRTQEENLDVLSFEEDDNHVIDALLNSSVHICDEVCQGCDKIGTHQVEGTEKNPSSSPENNILTDIWKKQLNYKNVLPSLIGNSSPSPKPKTTAGCITTREWLEIQEKKLKEKEEKERQIKERKEAREKKKKEKENAPTKSKRLKKS